MMSEKRETADVRILIRVPKRLAQALDARAGAEGRTRSMMARRILAVALFGNAENKSDDKG